MVSYNQINSRCCKDVMVSGYLELSSDVLRGGENFEVTMEFRTDQLNALMLFTYNTLSDDFILVSKMLCVSIVPLCKVFYIHI